MKCESNHLTSTTTRLQGQRATMAQYRRQTHASSYGINKASYKIHNELTRQHPLNTTFVGQASKRMTLLGTARSSHCLEALVCSLQRRSKRFHRLYKRSAQTVRLVKYVNHLLRWAKQGAVLNAEQLLTKTLQILQRTFGIKWTRETLFS